MTDPSPTSPDPTDPPEPTDAPPPPAETDDAGDAQQLPTKPAPPEASLALDAVIDPSVNFAALHNDVPAIKRLTLTNTGESSAEQLELRLWIDRDLSGVYTHRIERLDAGQSLTLDNIALPLHAQTLAHLTERDSADLHAEVRLDAALVHEQAWPIDALAFDEWEGMRALPELIAAFVTPNHPTIERLLGEAALHLERATQDRAISGYQRRDPARVRAIVQAIYQAVGDLAIGYINPPASFEETGQRVRLPDQLIERRLGTCLDLTLLLAALFEQAGLNPLVVMVRGHAFVGVWLSDERFPEPAVAEPLRLRKRVQLDEVLVLETTGLTHHPAMPFDAALDKAARQLDDTTAFHYAVDIRTTRARRIRPLPLRVKPGTYDLIDLERSAHASQDADVAASNSISDQAPPLATPPDEATQPRHSPKPQPPHSPPDTLPEADDFAIDLDDADQTAARLDNWKRRLLDLSLRNRVLNHRETKKSIPLEVPDAAVLEDRLAEATRFDVRPRAELMDGTDPRSAELHADRTGEDARAAYLAREVKDGRLHADLTEAELDKRLVEIYRAARIGLEESGANTLYLALGFLSWYETPTSEPARRAPILLIPVGLERLAAGRGFRLARIDEDPRINVTLLEKLRSEYGLEVDGLEDLAEDESGLDVPAILRRFRALVRDVPRWDVIEHVELGLFSFNKFLMWRDLQEHHQQLTANPVVRRLVDPGYTDDTPTEPLPEPRTFDAAYRPDQTLCPMDADSSQLAAVFAADAGRSFVLEGPPGTGKSQTITNLIAHALSQGKRVLFVSEKRAALEVVHRRLEQVGLGPFCLELHSNKANKRAVLEQLGEALDFVPETPPEGWSAHADRLQTLRCGLNNRVHAMHAPRPIGMSVYQATCELIEMRTTPEIELGLDNIEQLTDSRFAEMHDAIDRLAVTAPAVGSVENHPYRAAGVTRYTTALPDQLRSAITPAEEAIGRLGEAAAAVLDHFGFKSVTRAELSADAFAWLIGLGELLAEPYHPTPTLLQEANFAGIRSAVTEQIELARARDAERVKLLERYDKRIFNEPLGELRTRLADGMTALPVISWFKCYGPRKRLKLSLKSGATLPSGAALLDELDKLVRVRDRSMQLAAESNPGSVYAGTAWLNGEAQQDSILSLLDWAERLRDHFASDTAGSICGDASEGEMLRLAIDQRDHASGPDAHAKRDALRSALDELNGRLAALNTLMAADADAAWGPSDEPGRLDTIANTLEAWQRDPGLLRDWAHWCSVRDAAEALGLHALIDSHAARSVPAGRLVEVFRKSLLSQWHAKAVAAIPELADFHRLNVQRQIERFRLLDARHLELTAQQVRAELARRLPLQTDDAHANSEVGILRRQLKLKRRHMPVRKLVASLPNLLPRLKPCLLMSPLSVAQYLDAEAPQSGGASYAPFDLVVFDEASQIPVWDAVGAIARGQTAVVVGDSKQLPPTSFFQKLESDDDLADENDFVELESILDECSASGMPSMRLLWHYRSRHESLIAFSNAHYYDHRLHTFPSPADESDALGVTLQQVEGTYDRGETRTNRAEAEALIADVVERLKHETHETYRSIGIVTFSMAQQILIEDLLDQARRDHPAIEVFFSDAVDEPVFVKNLENVQGDERAAIYFSICYGPDESGKVAMNFGPLNREGGERRLNVAVTRARERVAVYSTLRAEQIDLSRTQAVGVAHLRGFLEYAERGALAIQGERLQTGLAQPMAIDHALAEALRMRGHTVDLRVGLSGYRVALGVRHPDKPDAYLLGIELDGPVYHSAATARDRDRTRPGVMSGLGWRLHRLWALDYLHDPDAEVERIERAIERALRGEADEPAISEDELGDAFDNEPQPRGRPRQSKPVGPAVYEPFVPSKPEGDSEAYYNPAKRSRVRKTLIKIAKREAPIHQDLLAKRLTLAWQVGRLTAKAAAQAEAVLEEAVAAGQVKRDGLFVWLAEQDPLKYDAFRVPADGDDAPRDLDEVPPQELAQAAYAVLRRTIAIPREDLQREVAELFGLSRLTPRIQPMIDDAVQAMLDQGRCVIDVSGKVALP